MRTDAPPDFIAALRSLRTVTARSEVSIEEVPGPTRLAPWTAALTAEVRSSRRDIEADDLATGRFVVLYDPEGQEAWNGCFRLVTLVKANVEIEVGTDPLLPEVAWSWLGDALDDAGLSRTAVGGTVTRVHSRSFGSLDESPEVVDLEVRASWTAGGPDLAGHLLAWLTMLCTVAGLPPVAEGVTALPRR